MLTENQCEICGARECVEKIDLKIVNKMGKVLEYSLVLNPEDLFAIKNICKNCFLDLAKKELK